MLSEMPDLRLWKLNCIKINLYQYVYNQFYKSSEGKVV